MKRIPLSLLAVALLLIASCNNKTMHDDAMKLFPVVIGDKEGFIDASGKIVVNPRFENVKYFHEGLAAVWVADSGWGYIDETGKMVISPQYVDATIFSEGLAAVVKKDSGCQYIDHAGNVKFRVDFAEEAGVFSGGRALFVQGGKTGFINSVGQVVIFAHLLSASIFQEGLCTVTEEKNETELSGYINENGEMKIPCQFGGASGFSNGLALVDDDRQCGLSIKKESM